MIVMMKRMMEIDGFSENASIFDQCSQCDQNFGGLGRAHNC